MPKNFAQYKRHIDDYLRRYLKHRKNSLKSVNQWGDDIALRLLTFVSKGKTLRGGLVLFAASAYGQPVSEDALRVAAALELIHSGLLIHDDIIDGDRMRRGGDTVFVQYEKLAGTLHFAEKKQFGQAMALCVGDATYFLAMELVSGLSTAHTSTEIYRILSGECVSVCLGQMQDVALGSDPNIPSSEDVLNVYRYKTARYTFSLPLALGGVLAHAQQKEIDILQSVGENIGLLFQMQDDMLNLFGSTGETGKPVGSDLREGKKTPIYLYLYTQATAEEKKYLDHTNQDPTKIYSLLEKYSVKHHIEQELNALAHQSHTDIEALHIPTKSMQDFHDMIDYIHTRHK